MIRILIGDDHELIRKGVGQIVSATHDIRVTGEAASGAEVIANVRKNEYDLVLLDISLPDRNGLEVLKVLKTLDGCPPVLVLSMHPEAQYAMRAMKAGASGYITKESALEELIVAIRRISQGRKYVSSSLAEHLLNGGDSEKAIQDILSDRELLVLTRITSGVKIGDIAKELYVSPKTVTTYKSRILKKLKLKGTADLVRYAMEHGLIP
jgi:two-component system invasion response regulator UvrY